MGCTNNALAFLLGEKKTVFKVLFRVKGGGGVMLDLKVSC